MSSIERATSRLGRGGRRERHEPTGALAPLAERSGDPQRRGIYRKLDVERLTARGFATPANVKTRLASDFRRIKRPLLSNMKAESDRASGPNPANLILITSALPGEGKTFVSINLALSIAAELDSSALLVDGDAIKSDVPKILGFELGVGLLDLVQASHAPESAVIGTNIDGLSVLPSGENEDNAEELFASERMAQVLHDLAEEDPQRVVLVDAPPLLAGTMASVLASLCGQVLMVVEAEQTPQAAVTEAVGMLEGSQCVRMMLNKATRRASQQLYYDYGYGYGYGRSS